MTYTSYCSLINVNTNLYILKRACVFCFTLGLSSYFKAMLLTLHSSSMYRTECKVSYKLDPCFSFMNKNLQDVVESTIIMHDQCYCYSGVKKWINTVSEMVTITIIINYTIHTVCRSERYWKCMRGGYLFQTPGINICAHLPFNTS